MNGSELWSQMNYIHKYYKHPVLLRDLISGSQGKTPDEAKHGQEGERGRKKRYYLTENSEHLLLASKVKHRKEETLVIDTQTK